MKRSPLNRKTPLRRQSAKKRRELRETHEIRHAYIEAGLPCECCGSVTRLEPHEIASGSYRHNAVYQPNAQLYLCRNCHEQLQGRPYAEQIAVRANAMVWTVNDCHGSQVVSIKDLIRALLNYV